MVTAVIIFIGALLVTLLWVGFLWMNSRTAHEHTARVSQLKDQLILHKSQVKTRQKQLDNYHFIKRNLDDALVPQWEIRLENVN